MDLTLPYFFFDLPLYTPIEIGDSNMTPFKRIIDCYHKEEFHGYNPWRKLESTFIVITDLIPTGSTYLQDGGHGIVKVKCKRTDDIFTFYIIWDPKTKHIYKVGQHPTVADFHISEIKQYSKLVPDEKLREFTRAIGLAANGVGIGSFVYLRRIFEHLISNAFNQAKSENAINDGDYAKSRMDDKIDLLHSYLPKFLVENKSMYSILSLGIHELDEETCLAHFDTLRVGIEIILDERLEELRKKQKIEEAKQKLSSLKGQIKK